MVLTHLDKDPLFGFLDDRRPYIATVLRHGQSITYGIESRAHLVKRLSEADKSEGSPSPEEVEVMIGNFPGVFDT